MYKAILFDFDNTLGNRTKSAYKTYRDMILKLTDFKENDIVLESAVQDCIIWDQYGTHNKNYVIENLNKNYHLNLVFDDFNTYWNENCSIGYELYPDAIDTCLKLKEKYRLGIVSNGNAKAQLEKIQTTTIDKYVEFVMISGNYDFKKPDVRIFNEALKKLNLPAEEVIFVGDIFSTDILGAYNAGLKPIIICPDINKVFRSDLLRINKISDLINIL